MKLTKKVLVLSGSSRRGGNSLILPIRQTTGSRFFSLVRSHVGLPPESLEVNAFSLVSGRHSFSGSNRGGIAETQEMLDFCAKHNINAEIELINIQQVNDAFERLEKGDVKYRFVIDMASKKIFYERCGIE